MPRGSLLPNAHAHAHAHARTTATALSQNSNPSNPRFSTARKPLKYPEVSCPPVPGLLRNPLVPAKLAVAVRLQLNQTQTGTRKSERCYRSISKSTSSPFPPLFASKQTTRHSFSPAAGEEEKPVPSAVISHANATLIMAT